MVYVRRTEQIVPVVSLQEMKEQLNILSSFDDDYVVSLTYVAEEAIEEITDRPLSEYAYEQTNTNVSQKFAIIKSPVSSVISVEVKKGKGQTFKTLTEDVDYFLIGDEIHFESSKTYDEVRTIYLAGFASGEAPYPLIQAVKLLAGSYYAHRQNEFMKPTNEMINGVAYLTQFYTKDRF